MSSVQVNAPAGDEADLSVVELAKARFERAKTFYSSERSKSIEDIRFVLGDSDNQWQWPEAMRRTSDANPNACLTINLTAQHCNQVINAIRQNRPAARVLPADSGADKKTAEIMGGLIRNIQVSSNADEAHDTGATFSIYGGEGYWRVVTEYDSDDTFDQTIRIKAIPNPMLVYIDTACREADKSDAEWGFVFEDISRAQCKRDHPEVDPASWIDEPRGWVSQDTVRRAEYFYCTFKDDEVLLLTDGSVAIKSKLEAEVGPIPDAAIQKRRPTKVKEWRWCKLVGGHDQPLDETVWLGSYLPIISVVGVELDVDGQRVCKGLVRDLKDAARMVNYSYSQAVTSLGQQNSIPYLVADEAVEGHENEWATANTSKKAYLPWNAFDENGNTLPKPERAPSASMPVAQVNMLQLSIEQMRGASGQQSANFGIKSEAASGIGIQRLKQQGEVATFHFPDNLARALKYEAKVLLDLIPKYYDTKRVVRILGLDGKEEQATLDPEMQQAYMEQQIENEREVSKIFNPTLGKYDVVIDTGPSYATQRQEASAILGELASRDPRVMEIAGDILFRAMDFPMAEQMAERWEKTIPPNLQDDKGQAPIPPQAQAQMQQMGQQMEQMGQMLDAAQQELERLQSTDMSNQTAAAKVQLDAQIREQELEIQRQKLAIDEYNAQTNRLKAEADIADKQTSQAQAAATTQEASDTEAAESAQLAAVVDSLAQLMQQNQQLVENSQHAVQSTIDAMMQTQAQLQEAIVAAAAPKQIVLARDQNGRLAGATVTIQ